MSDEERYRAVASRDPRFDGWFVTCVTSTGIYCRPSCPAITPKRANVRFLPTAAAAQQAGFRACLRCRPDAAPGSPEWNYRADLTARAMRLIADGVVDRDGVAGLAQRLGYTPRHLNRLLTDEVGAGPLALARAQRAQTARLLIETTTLGLAEIAFAAGFGSVRQFNDTLRVVYGRPPSLLRRPATPPCDDHGLGTVDGDPLTVRSPRSSQSGVGVRLAVREPLHAGALLEFLGARAVPGVDEVVGDAYRRTLRLPHGVATVALTIRPHQVDARLDLRDLRDLAPAVARCRRLLDLDADPVAIDAQLGADPALREAVAAEPGVRVPGAADGFEVAVRAVVGQQVSVAGARTLLTRLAPLTPRHLLELPDDAFPMPATRRQTLRHLATATAEGTLTLDPGVDRDATAAALREIPGIGVWTAHYVALRALGDPDILLSTDLGVRRGAAALGLPDDPAGLGAHARTRWAPWRSYATIRLWRQHV